MEYLLVQVHAQLKILRFASWSQFMVQKVMKQHAYVVEEKVSKNVIQVIYRALTVSRVTVDALIGTVNLLPPAMVFVHALNILLSQTARPKRNKAYSH